VTSDKEQVTTWQMTNDKSNPIDFTDASHNVGVTGCGLPSGLFHHRAILVIQIRVPSVGIMKNPILALPLTAVMRSEIALPLQHMLKIYTVGCLLRAWRSPRNQRGIEQFFDSPEQARHAVATCAAWLGIQTQATHEPVRAWWPGDRPATPAIAAA
jgi:hypothetical protein